MNKGNYYRNGLIGGIAGAFLTMIGDFLIGANPAADAPTGVAIIDLYADCLRNSDLRMIMGGMLGVIGMPIIGIGYDRIYETFVKKEQQSILGICGCSGDCFLFWKKQMSGKDRGDYYDYA